MMGRKFRFTLSLFRFLVLFTFVLISTMLIIIGSQLYSNITKTMDNNFVLRTANGYIANKEREYGTTLQVEKDMLIFYPILDEEQYICRVYAVDGKLMESLVPLGYDFTIGDGELIAPIDEFEIVHENGRTQLKMGFAGNFVTKILKESAYAKDKIV